MRIIVLYTFILFISSCCIGKYEAAELSSQPLNKLDLKYINRYVIEHRILAALEFDYIDVNEHPLEISILQMKYPNELWNNVRWPNDFFKEIQIHKVVPNSVFDDIKFVFSNSKVQMIHVVTLDKNTQQELIETRLGNHPIVFAIGDIHEGENRYYLPVLYFRKLPDTPINYYESGIYEFEYCGSGIYNFIKFHRYFFEGEGGSVFSEYIINTVTCN